MSKINKINKINLNGVDYAIEDPDKMEDIYVDDGKASYSPQMAKAIMDKYVSGELDISKKYIINKDCVSQIRIQDNGYYQLVLKRITEPETITFNAVDPNNYNIGDVYTNIVHSSYYQRKLQAGEGIIINSNNVISVISDKGIIYDEEITPQDEDNKYIDRCDFYNDYELDFDNSFTIKFKLKDTNNNTLSFRMHIQPYGLTDDWTLNENTDEIKWCNCLAGMSIVNSGNCYVLIHLNSLPGYIEGYRLSELTIHGTKYDEIFSNPHGLFEL